MKIDIHTHILPRSWPELEGVNLRNRECPDGSVDMVWVDGTFFRKVQKNLFDPATILEECDKFGTDVQVFCTVPVMFNYHLPPKQAEEWSAFLNDDIAKSVSHNPRRLVAMGTLPMQHPELAVAELRRCVKDLGFRGFQIGSHINSWRPDGSVENLQLSDASFLPIFQAAAELGVGIMVHPWDMEWCVQFCLGSVALVT
jgi:aminocarboxymuconate-semialdehyde decarboxylase